MDAEARCKPYRSTLEEGQTIKEMSRARFIQGDLGIYTSNPRSQRNCTNSVDHFGGLIFESRELRIQSDDIRDGWGSSNLQLHLLT